MLTAELQALFERAWLSGRYELLRVGNGEVLFRLDGVVLALDAVFADAWRSGSADVSHRSPEEQTAFADSLAELRDAGVFDDVPLESSTTAGAPGGILLMVTQTCNLRCTYCYGDGGTYGSATARMPLETLDAAIDLMLARAPSRKRYLVTFFGGEPLLAFEAIRHTVARCADITARTEKQFRYSITTNATLITNEIADFLAKERFAVMVSYDGPESAHRRFGNARPAVARIAAGIRKLVERGLKVQLRATLPRGGESLDEILRAAGELGASRLFLSPVTRPRRVADRNAPDLCLEPDHHRELQQHYREITKSNLRRATEESGFRVLFDPHLEPARALANGTAASISRCGACHAAAAVASDGTIFPCHRFVGMPEYAIGSIAGGVSAEKVDDFFREHERVRKEKCGTCWARMLCSGGCFYHNADGCGGFYSPDDEDCDLYRDSVRFSIGLMLTLRAMPEEAARRFLGT